MADTQYTPLTPADAPKSRWRAWHALVLAVLVAATCFILVRHNASSAAGGSFIQEEGAVFGTFYHLTYQAPRSLKTEVEAELQRVDSSLSMFNPESTISRINSNKSADTDTLFRCVFDLAQAVSRNTGGAFDITVAPLVNAWGFGFKEGSLPDSATIDSLRQLIGYQRVAIDDNGRLAKDDPRIVLDCSAIAKGFGVDCAAAALRRHGVENYMVEIGGEVLCAGTNPKGEAWRVGVNKPDDDPTQTNTELQTVLKLSDRALATSGNYRNYYVTDDGRRVAHTINPATGYPAQHSLLSATVLATTCAEADAYATAFMVMGLDSTLSLLPRLPQLQVYLIYDDGGRYATFSNISGQDK